MKLEDLSPELQEKAKACATAEELFALAKQEGIELSEEDLEEISGGRATWQYSRTNRSQPQQQQPQQPQQQPQQQPTENTEARGGMLSI